MVGAIRRRFRGLRGRLTLSYFVTALVALLVLDVVFVLAPDLIGVHVADRPPELARGVENLALRAAPYLARTPVDQAALATWLRDQNDPIVINSGLLANSSHSLIITPGQNAAVYLIAADGRTLADLPATKGGVGNLSGVLDTGAAHTTLSAALAGQTDAGHTIARTADGRTVAAAPIADTSGHVLGAVLLAVDFPAIGRSVVISSLLAGLVTLVPFGLLACIVGVTFGLLTARRLIRRLGGLAAAADSWSQGDFSVATEDTGDDELGQLARDLNRMADQIQTLLHSRQQLAVVEERQRLARDLHDSVKQQVFAASMQVAAARALARTDPEKTAARLSEAELMIGQAQKELNALIRELRPAALGDKGLVAALRELCAEWSRANGVAAEVRSQGERATPLDVEQALFRVAQEALANVSRHSDATAVDVRLEWDGDEITLDIADNGRGFDVNERTGAGNGLRNMRERIEALGGTLSLTSNADTAGGTRLAARAPVETVEPQAFSHAGGEQRSDA
ncbi:MAG TPA: histidine kinase [Ktedonobacterales bacterium]|nr:histidine kinase [Ktedonobacterales bacterium]